MSRIKVLDCTLRDGGYVNDWNFGEGSIETITNSLLDAGVDFIECGFITSKNEVSPSKSLFSSFEDADQRLKEIVPKNKKLLFMINFGDYEHDTISEWNESYVNGIRVAFHKKDMNEALDLCEDIKSRGYSIFIQPMNTMNYTKNELSDLLNLSNDLGPYAMYMVDSLGVMRGKEIDSLYSQYDSILDDDIKIGLHSHNNLQLSFSNAQEFIKCSGKGEIIIDSTLMGIGRGAGNLCTELIAQHLNENNNGEYDLLPILTTVDEVLYPLQSKYQWGYAIPYYLAATCGCHPNYATFLSNKQTLKVKDMSAILKLIPDELKSMYDQKLIEEAYLNFQSNMIDDAVAIKTMREHFSDKNVIIVAPGRSYKKHLDVLHQYANSKNCFIIAVNFIDPDLEADMVFFGNDRRYSEYSELIDRFKGKVVITSNIKKHNSVDMIINYTDYLNDDPRIIDNSGLMLMNILSKICTGEIGLIGFDGFDVNRRMNYYDGQGNISEQEYMFAQNRSISTKIKQLSSKIKIKFITPSMYENSIRGDY